jgi:adenylate kinase
MRRVVVLGPPAAGKGTHARRLAAELDVPHIATGDMLREEVAAATELGAAAKAHMDDGELVPDELVVDMIAGRLDRRDAAEGWILDGFPRDLDQARGLDFRLGDRGVQLVIALEVDVDELVSRISGRRTCPQRHVYHEVNDPPKRPGLCDYDGEKLYRRDDDTEDIIRHRIEIYASETKPLLDYYQSRGMLVEVDSSGVPEQAFARLRSALENA